MSHPLNLTHSPAVAQILRGVTGIAQKCGLGTLRLAIVDILAGLWRQFAPKQSAAPGD